MMGSRKKGRIKRRIEQSRMPHAAPQRGIGHLVDWALNHEIAFVLVGSTIFAMGAMVIHFFDAFASVRAFTEIFAAVWIFFVFAFVALVTEDNRKYARSGGTIRTLAGAIAGAAITLVFAAPLEGVLAAAIIGGFLGGTARHWLNHL
jgi:hypothetical protein